MPWLNNTLIRQLAALHNVADVVIPQVENGLQPLHALYGKQCLQPMEEVLSAGRRRIVSFFPQVRVQYISQEQIAAIDPAFNSFRNINTPADYFQLRAEYSTPVPEVQKTDCRKMGLKNR